jgi:hypothetical protein
LVQIGLADPRSYIALDKLSKKYGDIMSVKLGFVDAGKNRTCFFVFVAPSIKYE